jgi:MORN repeat
MALRPPRWLEASPDCEVRNRYDGKQWRQAETTTVTWTVPCEDGRAQGRGVLEWFRDGRLAVHYEGEMSKGRVTGHGELIDTGGIRRRGRWYWGRMTGNGVAEGPEGSYEGAWYKGKPEGRACSWRPMVRDTKASGATASLSNPDRCNCRKIWTVCGP